MSAVLFVGPSLSPGDHERLRGFLCLPPVAQGDVYRAARSRPRAIGIIDGYFQGVPSVWHKEILWAMAQGIHVFGAASMGALRAAELHAFGMRGVGRIFEAYRDGELTGDDEVAVLHGPGEIGYLTVTEPMVNIRATLALAVESGVLAEPARARLEALAKAQFYQERTWETVLAGAGDDHLSAFRDWLPRGKVDRKRADALAMVDAMTRFLEADPPPLSVSYSFEETETWAKAPWLAETGDAGGASLADGADGILDELRLEGEGYQRVAERALLRALACGDIAPDAAAPDRQVVAGETTAFRLSRGLARRQDLERWAGDHGMDLGSFERMMAAETQVRDWARANAANLGEHVLRQLCLSGDYHRLAQRAADKARRLAGAGTAASGPAAWRLVEWYFHERLDRDVPEDIGQYAAALGLGREEDFHGILHKEYLYLRMSGGSDDDS